MFSLLLKDLISDFFFLISWFGQGCVRVSNLTLFPIRVDPGLVDNVVVGFLAACACPHPPHFLILNLLIPMYLYLFGVAADTCSVSYLWGENLFVTSERVFVPEEFKEFCLIFFSPL